MTIARGIVPLRVVGLLGQGADRVEAEERIRGDSGTGRDRRDPQAPVKGVAETRVWESDTKCTMVNTATAPG